MAIIQSAAPENIRNAFWEGMRSMTTTAGSPEKTRQDAIVSVGGVPPAQEEHPIFTVGLQQLAEGVSVDTLRQVGWRILTNDSLGGATSGEIMPTAVGAPPALTRLARGPVAAAILQGAAGVEKLAEVQAGNFELRSLEIPSLLVQSFWLKSRDNATDFIVPVRTLSSELEVMKVYPAADFFRIVQGLAAQRLLFDDSPRKAQE